MFEGVPSGLVPGLDCQTALFLTFSIRLNRKMIEKPCRDGTLKMFTGSRTKYFLNFRRRNKKRKRKKRHTVDSSKRAILTNPGIHRNVSLIYTHV